MRLQVEERNYRITFVEDILGSWPADPDVWSKWIASKAPADWLINEEKESTDVKAKERGLGYTVFPQDEKGLHLFNYHVKGFLKEAAANCNHLFFKRARKNKKTGEVEEVDGLWAIRSKVDNWIFVQPRKLYFVRDGKYIPEPDEVLERPLRGETLQGPRISLVASEVLKAPVSIEFTVQLVENPYIRWEHIEAFLDYGVLKGISQWRNAGWGRFTWERLEGKAKTA